MIASAATASLAEDQDPARNRRGFQGFMVLEFRVSHRLLQNADDRSRTGIASGGSCASRPYALELGKRCKRASEGVQCNTIGC